MKGDPWILGIEISNPSSGPRGRVRFRESEVMAGPGVSLARRRDVGGWPDRVGLELLHEGARHDDDLMPAIDRLCRAHGVRPRDLGTIAVSIGPGGYTSLRIAVATAKMIAEVSEAETIAVPSALVAMCCVPYDAAPAIACLASKGDTAHATLFPERGEWWERVGRATVGRIASSEVAVHMEERIAARQRFLRAWATLGLIGASEIEALQPKTIVADRFLPESMRAAAERVGAVIVEPMFEAGMVAAYAKDFEPVDPLKLAPVYSREAEAVTQWRKRKAT